MREFDNLFQIDGRPVLAPDAGVTIELTDLDSDDSGRDEAGIMHRIVLRHGVPTWSLSYSSLTVAEYQYMEFLFAGKADFELIYRDDADGVVKTIRAYRSKHSITLFNRTTGLYKNYSFNIIAC